VFNIAVGALVTLLPWLGDPTPGRALSTSLLVAGVAAIVLGRWALRSDPDLRRKWKGIDSDR
jgi:hypothetical protein